MMNCADFLQERGHQIINDLNGTPFIEWDTIINFVRDEVISDKVGLHLSEMNDVELISIIGKLSPWTIQGM